jgi:hypothetical protein
MRVLLAALLFTGLAAHTYGQETDVYDDAGTGRLEILSPLPDSAVSGEEPVELSLLLPQIEGLSFSLWLDGADVTPQSEITSDYAFYLSPAPLAPGRHHIRVYGILEGDTLLTEAWSFSVARDATAPGTVSFPWEASLGLGWQHGSCDRDTSGLGLATPVGHQPSGEASFYGPLWGGLASGFLGYDPAYDPEPHGLVQFSRGGLELSLGEFYPDLSALAFADALPLGLLGRSSFRRLTLDFTACRTATADTTVSTFAQYLYGGRAGVWLGDSIFFALGFLQGRDQPSSLPDSVRFRTTTLVLADTIFGLTDTLFYADSLKPASNRIGWLSSRKSFGRYSVDIEVAGTGAATEAGPATRGWGYLAKMSGSTPALEASLAYTSTDAGFRSFGSPYLETDKNQLEGRLRTGWPRGVMTSVRGSVYKAFADSSPGLGWGLGGGWNLRIPFLQSLFLGLEYASRPYRTYRFQSRGASAALAFAAMGTRLSAGYGYNSSSSPGATQSHNASAEASRALAGRRAAVSLGSQYYQVRDASGTSNREKLSQTVAISGDLTASLFYRLQARRIAQTDRAETGQSYRQDLASLQLGWRF